MEAHLLMPCLMPTTKSAICFSSSFWSHTLIVKVDEGGRYTIMGETKDDALEKPLIKQQNYLIWATLWT